MIKIPRHSIGNGHPLDAEIASLYERKTELENTLAENWDYLRSDYKLIIVRSIFRKAGFGERSSILKMIINFTKVQETIGNFTIKALSRVGSILSNWFDKATQ